VAAVREAGGRVADDLRAIRVVWRRELIRSLRNRTRLATALAQPVLFLMVLGTGLSPVLPSSSGVNFRTFIFPGVLAMTVMLTSMFSAVSIVWDREFGFLREMLVAPVSRGSIVLGKCLGGATVATLQGALILLLAPLVGVPFSVSLIVVLLAEMALIAIVLTAFGTLIASRMTQIETFWAVMQMAVLPMFFLSGALFPLSNLPGWLTALTRLDPLTYAVDPMRRAVFATVDVPAATQTALNPGLTWGGWRLPTWLELAIVAVLGLAVLVAAVSQFSRAE
jgi:ABC-2 type transport system permease protein